MNARVRTSVCIVVFFLSTVLCAVLLPINASVAGASTVTVKTHPTLNLDGSTLLVVPTPAAPAALPVAPTAAAVVPIAVSPAGVGANPVADTLASPAISTPTTLGGCHWLVCLVGVGIFKVYVAQIRCEVQAAAFLFGFSVGGCLHAVKEALGALANLAMWAISPTIRTMAQTILKGLQKASIAWSNWLLIDQLGGRNTITDPIVSCHVAQFTQATSNCKDAYFLGQYNIMRQISLFLLLPLFMLAIIQSVLKGSLYMVTRAAFVMLPVAIFGTVAVVYLMQLMLNISNDLTTAIGDYTSSTTAYATQFTSSVAQMDTTKVNWFALLWMFVLLIATIVIYIELVLRQVGVYMAGLMLPLGFAAMVWPASAGVIKKLIELVLGLIFSKVFIAAALSLGIAALANSSAVGINTLPGVTMDATTSGLMSLISGALIFCLAAFTGVKVLQFTPAAMTAAEGRMAQTSQFWTKMQLSRIYYERMANTRERRNDNIGSGMGTRLRQAFIPEGGIRTPLGRILGSNKRFNVQGDPQATSTRGSHLNKTDPHLNAPTPTPPVTKRVKKK